MSQGQSATENEIPRQRLECGGLGVARIQIVGQFHLNLSILNC